MHLDIAARKGISSFAALLAVGAVGCGSTGDFAAQRDDGGALGADGAAAASDGGGQNTATSDAGTSDTGTHDGDGGDGGDPPVVCTVRVPADYPGVGEAVTALLLTGGTICVTSMPTNGSSGALTAVPLGTPPLTIVGYGRGANANHLGISVKDYAPGLFLRNIALAGLSIESSVVEIRGSSVHGDYAGAIVVNDTAGSTHAVIDGCDISTGLKQFASAGVEGAIVVYPGPHAVATEFLRVQNSYIHDTGYGLYYYEPSLSTVGGNFVFVNNTLANNLEGIELSPRYDTGGTLRFANNLFVGNATGARLVGTATNTLRILPNNNLYFGNTASFSGAFPPGSPFFTGDPKLDTSVPPRPTAGSATIGQADPAFAPTSDFLGRARGAAPDIGAVQH